MVGHLGIPSAGGFERAEGWGQLAAVLWVGCVTLSRSPESLKEQAMGPWCGDHSWDFSRPPSSPGFSVLGLFYLNVTHVAPTVLMKLLSILIRNPFSSQAVVAHAHL